MKLESWSDAHKAIVRKMKPCRAMPEDDFEVFWAKCVQSELDPLMDQALPVSRKANEGSREHPKWTTVYSFQSTEAGMLARAERFPDYLGVQVCAIFDEEPCVMNNATGEVTHSYNPTKRQGKLSGAWARVLRKARPPLLIWLDYNATKQDSPFWTKNPLGMLEKCGRVAAIRKAYPETFSGVYAVEEMPADGDTDAPIFGTRKVEEGKPTDLKVEPVISENGDTAPVPPVEVEEKHREEVAAICKAAEAMPKGKEGEKEYAKLAPRAQKLPKGSRARKVVADKLKAELARVKGEAPPPAAPPSIEEQEAERVVDGIFADLEGLQPSDAEGLASLRARAEKLPEGPARTRALSAVEDAHKRAEAAA